MAAGDVQIAADEAQAFDEVLGRLLIEAGKLDHAGLQRTRRVCEASGERMHVMLIKLGLVPEREVAEALPRRLDPPLADEADHPGLPLYGDRVSVNFLKEARVLDLRPVMIILVHPGITVSIKPVLLTEGCGKMLVISPQSGGMGQLVGDALVQQRRRDHSPCSIRRAVPEASN